MTGKKTTFGHYLAEARLQQGLTQKALAARIQREDGKAISPQYLNDIEYDRRQPSSDHLIHQFAKALKLKADYLYYLAGKIPTDIRRLGLNEGEIEKGMEILRGEKRRRKRR